MPPVRRLPVLQDASTSDEERPAWHWTVIGVAFIFSMLAPLAMLASWARRRVLEKMLGDLPADELGLRLAGASSADRLWLGFVTTGLPLVAYAFSCWASGALVGRFGAKAGPKEAAISGGCAALISAGLTFAAAADVASIASVVLLLPIGVAASWFGGRFGLKKRVASVTRQAPPPAAGGGGPSRGTV